MSPDDRATEEESFLWELRNGARPAPKEFRPGQDGYGPEFCANEDCEEPMPEIRRRHGRQFCTDCQDLAERRAKRGY
jgi:RNA polymerase-binding transcription factor DksA